MGQELPFPTIPKSELCILVSLYMWGKGCHTVFNPQKPASCTLTPLNTWHAYIFTNKKGQSWKKVQN